jgi:hypothetical protein
VIRNIKPEHVVEIGTFKGGTTEAMARAVVANGFGRVHTVNPFDHGFNDVLNVWPVEIRDVLRCYPVYSMEFWQEANGQGIVPEIVLVDGHHDYEFASFDIEAAAQRLKPGGFIFVDDVSQAGPYFAANDFLDRHRDWMVYGKKMLGDRHVKAFKTERATFPGTDIFVLQAPSYYVVGERPRTFGNTIDWTDKPVRGLKLDLGKSSIGTIRVQCVLRGFRADRQVEFVEEGNRSITLDDQRDFIEVPLKKPLAIDENFDAYTVEPWLWWEGEGSLPLREFPAPY